MDPPAKEDVLKFQEKLERIDRELDRINKQVLAAHLEFSAIREEFHALEDKKSAYEQAYTCLSEQLKLQKQGKQWKIKKMFSGPKFAIVSKRKQSRDRPLPVEALQHNYKSESPAKRDIEVKMKEVQDLKQLERDIQDLHEKMADVKKQIDLIKDDYSFKKNRYLDSKLKLEESRHYKERVKAQMNGFLIMYEVKKEETLKELSKKLQQSDKFKQERVF